MDYQFLTGTPLPAGGAGLGDTTVWLIRHGETHNPGKILYGRLPRFRLNEVGSREAMGVGRLLANRPLDAIYSSPLLRARTTARSIAQYHPHLRVQISRDIIEMYSSWEGQPHTALEAVQWDIYGKPRAEFGEDLQTIYSRMRHWLNQVLRRHAGGEIAGVTHGDPILVLLAALRGAPITTAGIRVNPYIPTASSFELRFSAAGEYLGGTLHSLDLTENGQE